MNWISHYQLFLFDFDGLLVDTERLHHQAYQQMCANHGYHLSWDFHRYSEAAHHTETGVKDGIYAEFPTLRQQDWNALYEEKRQCYFNLLEKYPVSLMPGVETLLLALQASKINRCVVTHSPASQILCIRKQNPILNTIPNWITREDYQKAKPNPECYQIAIQKLSQPNDRIIGFEDSPRGLKALLGTSAKAVLICPSDASYLKDSSFKETIKNNQVAYYPSFEEINSSNFL